MLERCTADRDEADGVANLALCSAHRDFVRFHGAVTAATWRHFRDYANNAIWYALLDAFDLNRPAAAPSADLDRLTAPDPAPDIPHDAAPYLDCLDPVERRVVALSFGIGCDPTRLEDMVGLLPKALVTVTFGGPVTVDRLPKWTPALVRKVKQDAIVKMREMIPEEVGDE